MCKPTLLLTRPAASAARFAATLDPAIASRAALLISPLLEIVDVDAGRQLENIAGAVFSSVHGVQRGPEGAGRPAYCVGHQTAVAATARGWQVTHEAQDADALVATLEHDPVAVPLVHLSGTHQRGDIAERLTHAGMRCARHIVYDQRSLPLTEAAQQALAAEGAVVAPLFSPRTAAQFMAQAQDTSRVHAIALSAAVAQQINHEFFAGVETLAKPTGVDMARAVEMLLSNDRLP